MKTMIRLHFVGLLLVLWSGVVAADLSQYPFDNEQQTKDFKELLSEIRCLVCQNQSLADSAAGLADDLRLQVYELKRAGKTDAEVLDFLVARYGDFVLYRPPFKPSTYLLWLAPPIVFLLLIVFVVLAIRKQGEQKNELTEAGKQQALDLINKPKDVE